MKLDLTEIQNKRRDTLDFDFEIDPASRDDFALLPWGEEYDGPVRVHARAFDANGYVRVDFDAKCTLTCRCTRCLADVSLPLSASFRRYAGESANAAYGEDDDGADDVLRIVDSSVDGDADVMEELALAAPETVLCSDDCPGLCPRCGKKIGEGCECEPVAEDRPADPRLDVFRRLREKMED